jgi:hypothetical protein
MVRRTPASTGIFSDYIERKLVISKPFCRLAPSGGKLRITGAKKNERQQACNARITQFVNSASRRSISMHGKHIPFLSRITLSVALFSFAASLGAQAPQWKTYSYPADGFSA